MSNYFSLIKVFLKSIKRESSSNKRTKHVLRILIAITLLLIIIPFLIISASFVYDTTIKLTEIGYETIGLQIVCYIMCIFIFIFGFTAIINELYFSNDIEKLLPLPIKPVELALSKFTSCFIIENIIQIIFVIICIISYMIALNINFINIILSLIQILTLSLVPMIYSGIICLIIMHFAKYIKNKEHIKKISTIFVLLLFIGILFFINKIKDFNFQLYLENFVNGDHKFLNIMNIIFPQINLFADTLTNMSILSLLKYIVINAVYILVFIGLIKVFYLKSVIDLSNKSTSSIKKSTNMIKNSKEKNVILSYLSKEIKILFRTPSFFINCILINIIWPFIIYIFYEIGSIKYDLSTIKYLISINDEKTKMILLLFILGISILITSMNSISSTSFSREGKNFQFMKYIPISYKTQLLIKYLTSFIISFCGLFIYSLVFFIILNISTLSILEYFIIIILSISSVSLLGIFIDSLQPKLYWEDENNALRENYNTFISMGISALIFIIISLISYSYLFKKLSFNSNITQLIVIVILIIINLIVYLINKKITIKNIIEQE